VRSTFYCKARYFDNEKATYLNSPQAVRAGGRGVVLLISYFRLRADPTYNGVFV
jgi:hypothetical protein